jgi:hydrogenase expression/formation protein HypE
VGATLNEIAVSSNVGIILEETRLPVSEAVRGACDVLGLDPLYVANEGKLLAFIDPAAAETVLAAVKSHEYGRDARIIGHTTDDRPGKVFLNTAIGGRRIVDMLTGEQLPRIC